MIINTDNVKHYGVYTPCHECGEAGAKYFKKIFANKTTHIRAECDSCGKFISWAKQVNPDPVIYGRILPAAKPDQGQPT